eukprot:5534882-Alexandrium_andersonii.AAC.1
MLQTSQQQRLSMLQTSQQQRPLPPQQQQQRWPAPQQQRWQACLRARSGVPTSEQQHEIMCIPQQLAAQCSF